MKKPADLGDYGDLFRLRLSYNPNTGDLIWNEKFHCGRDSKRWNLRYPGTVAGMHDDKGYLRVSIRVGKRDRLVFAHRICWFLHYGYWPMVELDHRNHIRDDNRIDNLRLADRGIQARNLSMAKNNTSGVTGVDFYRGKWRAQSRYKGVRYFLGMHPTREVAASVVAAFRKDRDFDPSHGMPSND